MDGSNAGWRPLAMLALAIGLLSLAVASPRAFAAEKAIWGPLELPGGGSAFPVYNDLGVDTYQIILSFATTARERPANPADPNDPAYRWPRALDEAAASAAANGIDLAVLVNQSPRWANGGRSELHAPEPEAYASFMAAASRRYPSVRRWMIWGEPNRADRFLPNEANSPVGPRAYARILDAAYAALKAVSPSNIVIGGMTWTGGDVRPAPFMRFMRLPNGRPPRLDWFGHNPFPFRFPDLARQPVKGGFRDISDMDTFSRQLRRTYGPRARFWLSEFLIQSDHASSQFRDFVTREEQARWLAAAYQIADQLPSVAGLGWLDLVDQGTSANDANWGLLTTRGARKPAYAAYRRAPSERLRPGLRAPKRVQRVALVERGVLVRLRLRKAGRLQVTLRDPRGRLIKRRSRRARAGVAVKLRLRGGGGLGRGRYTLVVQAPRASTVRRSLTVFGRP